MYENDKFLFWLIFGTFLLFVVYTIIIVRFFLKRISESEKRSVIVQTGAEVNKLRFQAYERFTLLLERLSPESLIVREQNPKNKGFMFHAHLLRVIRHEFSHNIAMQIYVSAETWHKIKTAKDKLLQLINTSLSKTKPESSALELGKIIIEDAGKEVNAYFNIAIEALRSELDELFRI
ncbi:MAG: hypothetical protein FWH18_06170 [Marinilabiliaceae bacterium]|nr:hypothetical protein [Marinilabiliaceae bacterium]